MPEKAPYGTWRSPITSALLATGGVRLSSPWLEDDDLYWLELRPTEGGRSVLVRRDAHGQIQDMTPPGLNVRTRVHEYGGGAFAIHGKTVYFSNDQDQRLYRHDLDNPTAAPRPITPEPDAPRALRYADARITPNGTHLVCVMEVHGSAKEPQNRLAVLPTDGSFPPRPLVTGHDFVAAPRLSPDGRKLAWLAWDHPRMPWDGTELFVADFHPVFGVKNIEIIAGGPEESVVQPEWGPDGNLYYVSDRTGWWNIYSARDNSALVAMDAEFGDPMWIFGQSRYAFLASGRIAAVYTRHGMNHLALSSPAPGDHGTYELEEIATPYTSFGYRLVSDGQSKLAFAGAWPGRAAEIVVLDVDQGRRPEVVKQSLEIDIDAGYISQPRPIDFPTQKGRVAHALFYPPTNKDHQAPADERPPLIVCSHGGPTASTSTALDLDIQFWTSRGFAVVDVDYGGSTGYGREYRERLREAWGIVDTEDCVNAARFLADEGEVDGQRMAIRGASAGGYTTLCALTFQDVFTAGASYFGVADLESLAKDTHKFESRYLDGLVGAYPQERERYIARSPIHHTDRLSCPIILLQGLEDKVVPPSQAAAMIQALEQKKLPWAYVAFEGEQHGFRKAESIRRAAEAELYFYSRVFGFTPADELQPVEIKNLA